jgi:hypothetical protein
VGTGISGMQFKIILLMAILTNNLHFLVVKACHSLFFLRYNPSTGTLHLHYNAGGAATAGGARGGSNPPALLQRLLGQAGASDVFQLTSSISTGQARFHFITSDTNMRLLNNPDAADADAFDDFFFQDSVLDGDGTGGSSVVASVPSPLARWSEEARVLDGDSIHDGMTGENSRD